MILFCITQLVFSSFVSAGPGFALRQEPIFRNRPGWIARRRLKNVVFLTPRGGSQDEEEDEQEKIHEEETDGNLHEVYDDSEEVEDVPYFGSDHDMQCTKDVDITPFDDDSESNNAQNNIDIISFDDECEQYDAQNNIGIIPFDDDCQQGDAQNNVDIIPFDDDSQQGDAQSNVDIIPFDDDYEQDDAQNIVDIIAFNDDYEKDNAQNNVDVVPFDDYEQDSAQSDVGMALFDDNYDPKNVQKNVSIVPCDDEKEVNQPSAEIDDSLFLDQSECDIALEDDRNSDTVFKPSLSDTISKPSLSEESSGISDSPPELLDNVAKEPQQEFQAINQRIQNLLQTWRKQDMSKGEDNHDSKDIRNLMHERAQEYVDELLEFQQEFEVRLSQDKSLPVLSKAPHPRKVLRYLAPKIQAIKKSPEIMLRIRSAEPDDVMLAASAIGIVSCLTDLYNVILKDLGRLDDTGTFSFDNETVKKEIIRDRRFEQLLECVSCGIDVKQSLVEYKNILSSAEFEGGESNADNAEERRVLDDEWIENDADPPGSQSKTEPCPQPECMRMSDSSRFILGLLTLGFEKETKISSHFDASSCIVALAVRSKQQMISEYKIKALDENERRALLVEIVECIRVTTCVKDVYDANINFLAFLCLQILGEDMGDIEMKSDGTAELKDIKLDDIVDRLALSEDKSAAIGERNEKISPNGENNTSQIEESVEESIVKSAPEPSTGPSCLLDYMSQTERIGVLKSVIKMGIEARQNYAVARLVKLSVSRLRENISILDEAEEIIVKNREFVDASTLLASSTVTDNNRHQEFRERVEVAVGFEQTFQDESIKGNVQSTNISDANCSLNPEELSFDAEKRQMKNLFPYQPLEILFVPTNEGFTLSENEMKCWPIQEIESSLSLMDSAICKEKEDELFITGMSQANNIIEKEEAFTNMSSDVGTPRMSHVKKVNASVVGLLLYDFSVIVNFSSAMNDDSLVLLMEDILKLSEDVGYGTVQEMESVDVRNLMSGISSLVCCFQSSISPITAKRLCALMRQVLLLERRRFTMHDISSLLLSIATMASTGTIPIMNEFLNEECVQSLIEYGMRIMKDSAPASCDYLTNLVWCYAESNNMCAKGSWEDFQAIGQIVSSICAELDMDGKYSRKLGRRDDASKFISEEVDFGILCKLGYALSLMDLDAHEINQSVLKCLLKDDTLMNKIDFLDHVRLIYSIAKAKQTWEFPIYDRVVRDCMKCVIKLANSEKLPPYTLAIVLWSVGRLCGQEVPTPFSKLPSYTRDELAVLSPKMLLRFVKGIVTVFDSPSIQTDSRTQLLLKNLLLRLDQGIETMAPSELCATGRVLMHLRSLCLSGEGEAFGEDHSQAEFRHPTHDLTFELDDDNSENEEEESVISSLFPSSNRRDVLQLCDTVLVGVLSSSNQLGLDQFSPKELNLFLNLFNSLRLDPKKEAVFEALKNEIERRMHLAKERLIPHLFDVGHDENRIEKTEEKNVPDTCTFRLRRLFTKEEMNGHERSYIDAPHNDNAFESMQIASLLHDTLCSNPLNEKLLRSALDTAYHIGRCNWKTTEILHNSREGVSSILTFSELYP